MTARIRPLARLVAALGALGSVGCLAPTPADQPTGGAGFEVTGDPDIAAVDSAKADAAAETAVGLAIIISIYRRHDTIESDKIDLLKW